MATHTATHLAATGKTVYAYPTGQSLTDWTTHRAALTEGTGDNVSRYTGTLNDANGYEWLVFEQALQPASWDLAVASISVAGLVQGTIQTLDALDTAQDAQHATTQGKVDATQADLDTITGTGVVAINMRGTDGANTTTPPDSIAIQAAAAAAITAYDPPTRTEATSDKAEIIAQGDAAWVTGSAADLSGIQADVDTLLTRTAGGVTVSVSNPVATSGGLTLYAGAEYASAYGNALVFTVSNYSGPDLTSTPAILRFVDTDSYEAGALTSDLELTDGTITADGTTLTITFEMAETETAALALAYPLGECNYVYSVLTNLASQLIQHAQGAATVKPIPA